MTETAVELPIASTRASHRYGGGSSSYESNDFGGRVVFTGGSMFNLGARRAIGATATLSMDDPDALVPNRLEVRYRKWIDERSGFDFSGGLARRTIRGEDELESARALGVTASAGVSNTWFGIDGRVDLLRGKSRPVAAAFIGVRAGSRAAPIVTAAGFALFLAAFAMAGPNY